MLLPTVAKGKGHSEVYLKELVELVLPLFQVRSVVLCGRLWS